MSGGICSIISAALVAMGITFGIMPFLLDFCRKRGYYDLPGGRKVHHCAIPRLGGLLFMPSMLVALVSVLILSSSWWQGVLTLKVSSLAMAVGAFLIYIIGTVDDLVGMKPNHKFAVQLVAALLMPFCGLLINNFYGLFGLHELPVWFSYPFTVFVILLVVNSINLIDGIDGLASGLSSVALLVFGFLFIEKGLWIYSMLAFSTFGVLVPFFYYNVFGSAEHARKIFMGDTGSLTLGYILSFLAIKYSQNTESIPVTQGAFVIAFSTLIVPAFDVVRVVIVRIYNGKSPFEPDKNHIHHQFLAMGFTVRQAMLLILLVSCVFSGINILLMPYVDNTLMLIGDIVVWIGLNLWWSNVRRKKITA